MTSPSEDFTSDDLINGGFPTAGEEEHVPRVAPPPTEELPVEIPRGADDNSELFCILHA